MENPFYNDIYEILQTKGCEGLPVGIIAKQVYNRHAGLFNTELTYERVYQNVRFFLWAQSCKPSSPFMGTANRGWYALKPNVCRQMRIDFTEINLSRLKNRLAQNEKPFSRRCRTPLIL